MSTELRLDFGRLGKAERTPQGGVRIPAFVTRVGVLSYRRADGTTVKELRHPDEVFNADSLATLEDAPVTNLHPPSLVTTDTYQSVSVGHVRGAPKRRDGFVETRLVVQDAKTVGEINDDKLSEVSCGYSCKIDGTPGSFNGEKYDQIQRDIRYNHVALGPRNWGRAGNDVSLRLDGAAVQVQDAPSAPKEVETMKTIRIDGVDYEVGTDAHMQAQARMDERGAAELSTATKALDTLQGRYDAQAKELATAKEDLEAAPARLDSMIDERLTVIDSARSVLGEEAKFDGKTNVEIMRDALTKADPEIKLDGKSDDYIAGRFESLPKIAPAGDNRSDANDRARAATKGAVTAPSKLDEYRKRTDEARKISADAWMQPLASSTSKGA